MVLERLPSGGKGIVAGRSECPHCHHVLAWYDLIPLISYATLGGRCRYCRARISPRYPLLELAMAGVFAASVLVAGLDVLDLAILFGLVALFFFDLRYQILPDVFVFPLIALAVLRLGTTHDYLAFWGPVSGVLFFGFFLALYLVSHGRWLGFGDVKLALLIGLLFGRSAVGVTLLAIWSGAAVGVGLMLTGRANRQTALPFGSFWAAVAIITMIWPTPVYELSRLFLSYGFR